MNYWNQEAHALMCEWLGYAQVCEPAWRDAEETAFRMAMQAEFTVHRNLGLTFKGMKEVFTIMAKQPSRQKDYAKWRGFVNISLSDSDKDDYVKWCKKNEKDFAELLETLLEARVKITISWDSRSKCFMSSMKCDDPDSLNGGLCITSRSRDMSETIWLALYKHYAVCNSDWSQYFGGGNFPTWG